MKHNLQKKKTMQMPQFLCCILYTIFWIILTISVLSVPVLAKEQVENQAADQAETVRVAVTDYPNYIQMEEDGTVTGYAYEYLQKLQKYTGWNFEFIEMNFSEAMTALEKGRIDLIAGNQYTEERAKLYDYSERDMGEGGSVLCVRNEDNRYCYNDYASYGGMKIAALAGSVRMEQAKEKLAGYEVQAEFVEYDTDEECKNALRNKEVDAVLMSSIRCESAFKILARLDSIPLYFCTNKQRPEVKIKLDQAMEQNHLDHPYFEENLNKKYYGAVQIQLAFTQEEKNYVADSEPIIVSVSTDLKPFEYMDKEDHSYRGVVPDVLELIQDYSGLEFRFLPRGSAEELKQQVASGEVQMIASVADKPGMAEYWNVELTETYRDSSAALLISDSVKNYRDTDSIMVLREGYPYLEQTALEEGYSNFIYVDGLEKCLAYVKADKADMSLLPTNCADILLHEGSAEGVSVYPVQDTDMDFSMGVSKSADPLLLSVLNKSIATITKQQRTELLVNNLNAAKENVTFKSFFQAHRMELVGYAFAFLAVVILGMAYLVITRQRQNRRLEEALRRADAASHAKTEFLSRMSHDMRTPMNGILGLSYLMEDQIESKSVKKELLQLRETGQYLLQLINDVLDLNKVESGKIELQPRVCSEEAVFDSIIAMIKPQTEKKSIHFYFEKIDVEWTYMMLDAQRVKQIFVNLLGNAVKFTPKGGNIDFIIERAEENERMIRNRYIIRDNGIGMTEEFLPMLFEPFSQENRAPEGTVGTGLGMAIVKSLVELMGGEISVKSREGKGTKFTVYLNLPLAKKTDSELQNTEMENAEMPVGVRILLAEDQPLNAQIAVKLLEKKGAVVVWKENGSLAVDAYEKSEPGYYDAILMDIRMPVLDGLEAARKIRGSKREDAGTIPIIAMTANAYDEDIRKSLDAGMNAHIAKPIEPEVMYQTISRYLQVK